MAKKKYGFLRQSDWGCEWEWLWESFHERFDEEKYDFYQFTQTFANHEKYWSKSACNAIQFLMDWMVESWRNKMGQYFCIIFEIDKHSTRGVSSKLFFFVLIVCPFVCLRMSVCVCAWMDGTHSAMSMKLQNGFFSKYSSRIKFAHQATKKKNANRRSTAECGNENEVRNKEEKNVKTRRKIEKESFSELNKTNKKKTPKNET